MKTYCVLLFAAIILISSCKKDNIPDVPPVNEGPTDVSEFNLGDTIEFGLTDNMLIDNDSVVLQNLAEGTVIHEMDLDADGTIDFQIRLTLSISLGYGAQSFSNLIPQHANATIHGLQLNDTNFVHNDTLSATLIQRTYSCERLALTDTFNSTTPNVTKVRWSNSGDLLTTTDQFYSEAVKLSASNAYGSVQTHEPPYTINRIVNRQCFVLPSFQVVYIGIAMLDGNGGVRLGWLKVKSGGTFVCYERALQEL